MKKSDIQSIYKQVQRNKYNKKPNKTLFNPKAPKNGGCTTCGKVTWKPYK